MENIEPDKWYKPKELAKRYNVSTRTIQRLIQKKEIPALGIGRQRRIKGIDVIAFEKENWNI